MTGTGWQKSWVRTVTTLLTAAVMVMIFCFSMENAEQSDQRSGVIAKILIKIIHPDYEQMEPAQQKKVYDDTQLIVRKCAHFSEYTILGFMIRICLESWFGDKKMRTWILPLTGIAAGILYACTDEIHQLAIDGRYGTWTDVAVDGSGVVAGAVLGILLVSMTCRKKENETGET